MDKYIKVVSNQQGPYTESNNRLSFQLPPGKYDLTRAYISLRSHISTTETTTATGTGVHNMFVGYTFLDQSTQIPETIEPFVFVRHCNFSTSKVGDIERLRRVDVLRHNLNQYDKTDLEKLSKGWEELSPKPPLIGNQLYSIHRELHKEGEVVSREVSADTHIHLKDLFNVCKFCDVFDTDRMGQSKIELEVQPQRFKPFEAATPFSTAAAAMSPITAAADNFAITELTTVAQYDTLDLSPFYVSQKVKVSNTTGTGGNFADQEAVITKIVRGADDKLTLTLSRTIHTIATSAQTLTAITVQAVVSASSTLTFTRAELMLPQISSGGMKPLIFSSYTLEEFKTTATASFKHLFQVEPECVNVHLMFPQDTTPATQDDMRSIKESFDKFRISIDNKDIINRDVSFEHDRLYDDLMLKAFVNTHPISGYSYSTIQPQGLGATYDPLDPLNGVKYTMLSFPVPETQREKLVQVNIDMEAGRTLDKVLLYKEMPKQLS